MIAVESTSSDIYKRKACLSGFPILRAPNQPSAEACQGLNVATPVGVRCCRLHVTTVRPCSSAAAAISRSVPSWPRAAQPQQAIEPTGQLLGPCRIQLTAALDAALNLAEAHHAEVAILLPLPRNAVHHPVIPLAATSSERTMASNKTVEQDHGNSNGAKGKQPTCNLHSREKDLQAGRVKNSVLGRQQMRKPL
jgi:hypothetical protein